VIPLPPNKTTQVQVTVAAAGLVVAKSPAP
jgi:hypothetical protein